MSCFPSLCKPFSSKYSTPKEKMSIFHFQLNKKHYETLGFFPSRIVSSQFFWWHWNLETVPHIPSTHRPEGEVVELFAITAYGAQLRNATHAICGCHGRFCISMGFQAGELQREHYGNVAASWLLKDCREKKFGI